MPVPVPVVVVAFGVPDAAPAAAPAAAESAAAVRRVEGAAEGGGLFERLMPDEAYERYMLFSSAPLLLKWREYRGVRTHSLSAARFCRLLRDAQLGTQAGERAFTAAEADQVCEGGG